MREKHPISHSSREYGLVVRVAFRQEKGICTYSLLSIFIHEMTYGVREEMRENGSCLETTTKESNVLKDRRGLRELPTNIPTGNTHKREGEDEMQMADNGV